MNWKEIGILLLILIGAFVVRVYRLNSPIADWHSWRQADTSAVSRNFVQNGIDMLHPTFEDISNVPSGFDNPKGYRFVEFPLYNLLQAEAFISIKHFSLEAWGRLITIFMSLFSLLCIYLLAKKYIGWVGALASAFFFAFIPYNIYYSRVILPDPSMVATTLGAIYFFDRFVSSVRKSRFVWFGISVFFAALALLLKPYAIFFFLPILWLSFKKWGIKTILSPWIWIFFIVGCAPLVWWRWWMLQFPSGIPVSGWLFNAGNIRFTGAYFYWLFADRVSRLILGYYAISIVVMGFLSQKKSLPFFLSFVLGSLAYLVVIARGNVQHDYYQILIIPTLAFLFGLGVDTLFSLPKEYNKILVSCVVGIVSVAMIAFGWYFVRDYFNINNPNIVVAGQAVDKLTPKNAKIIAPYDGDTSFLYQTNRVGWASLEKDLPIMIQMGADYLVLVNPTQNDVSGWGKQYKIVASTPAYLLLNLHEKL